MASGDRSHGLEQGAQARFKPPKQAAPGPLGGTDLAGRTGQQPQGQGAVGDQFNAQLPANLGHATGRHGLGGQQRQLHLQAGHGHPLGGQLGHHLAQPDRTQIGKAQAGHLAAAHQIGQAEQQGRLLPGGIAGGAPVQLHPIELALQALLGRREGAIKTAPAQAPGEGCELGGQTTPGALGRRKGSGKLAQQLLTAAVPAAGAIGIGGVEKTEIELEAAPKGRRQLVIQSGVIAPKELVAPGPGANADGRLQRGWLARELAWRGTHRRPGLGAATGGAWQL